MRQHSNNDTDHPRLLPANPTFAGHQTFAFRSGWLKKGMDAIQAAASGNDDVFASDDALVTLGVGKNMVQSIRHWLVVTRVAEDPPERGRRRLEPTALGAALFGSPSIRASGWDPFLEDPGSLWLLHWQLAGPGSLAFTWTWTFNCFREYEFSRQSLTDALLRSTEGRSPRTPSRETIGRDVDCLIHSYARDMEGADEDALDCPLGELGLIRHSLDRRYAFVVGPKPDLPPAVFYYAALSYWNWRHAGSATLSTHDLAYAEGSPGQAFKLDIDSVLAYLDRIEDATKGRLSFTDTPLVQQVVRTSDLLPDPMTFLRQYYHARRS